MYFAKYLLSIEEFIPQVNESYSGTTTKDRQSYMSVSDRSVNSGGLEYMDTEKEKALMERAFLCVDETRREKANHMRHGRARAACLGAGLLLQLAVAEALGKKAEKGLEDGKENSDLKETGYEGEQVNKEVSSTDTGLCEIKRYSASQLLFCVENMPRLPLSYTYGEKGKPYFRDLPFYFNLSHSGDYVLCGLAAEEIGADIQQHCGKDVGKLARRFFSAREADILEQAGEEREKLFYRLWARKEAYGKLTGGGVAEVLGVDMLPENWETPERARGFGNRNVLPEMILLDGSVLQSETVLPNGRRLIWEEYNGIEDYSISFLTFR